MTSAETGSNEPKICPVSYAQQRLWLTDRLDPGTPAYNIVRPIRMRGRLSVPALRDSLSKVVARHESLRTTFAEIDGEPMQVIAPSRSFELQTTDLSALPPAERESEAEEMIRVEASRPFDLAAGPIIRAVLLTLSKDEHVLLLLMHHIVTDAWSMSVLFKEIAQLYEAAVTGRPSRLPVLPMQYADFARWQRASLTSDVLERHLAYWRQQLTGVNALLDLPADRARPAERSARGAVQRLVIPKTIADHLQALSRTANATLFMTLLAAFQTLLWRYTGCDDIVVGAPTAGRSQVELEPLIGFFVNTVVLRTKISGNPRFRELLAQVREVTLEAAEHEAVPIERLIEELNVPRSLSHTPLVQVMFILQNAPKQTFELPALILEELEFDNQTAKFDLTVEMAATDAGLLCDFEYSTDIFEHSTVTRMLAHFQNLLEGIATDPEARLSDLPLLGASEQHQLLVEWNDTGAAYPDDQCIHQLFEAQAARTPQAVALVAGEQQVTYRELNTRANQLASHLRARGVGRGVLVALCIERSIEAVVGVLGILKAGGAYVPMDPTYPRQRLAFMLEDSGAPLLLTARPLLDRAPRGAAETICVDGGWNDLASMNPENPSSGVAADDPAYVIYTSGSSGTPKGVIAPHRASINRFSWMWNRWKFTPTDVCCQKTALSFVDSVWEIFGPLLQGVRTVIVPDRVLEDPLQLVDALAAHRVTRIVLVPPLLRLLLDTTPDIATQLPNLKLWVTSGEAITPELARRAKQALPQATLVNLYGSSEVAADVTSYVITASESRERIPIGRPITNTRIYVLDRCCNPVPVGVAGEIHVGGDGLARGYLHNPELTSKKFVADRFGRNPEARLYATGDRGRFLSDGNLEFLGRMDDQVKIRGVRIELGEVESVLCAHPAVRVAVVVVAGAAQDARLIAYVVPHHGAPGSNDLRRFVRERLPDHMVPASFVVLQTLPLTPSGKVDRRALPAPERLQPESGREYIAPRTREEQALADIVSEVLGLERVGVHDNFFELGGHSLLGVRVVARVRRDFRVELPLRRLFEEPTVAGLALEIAKAETAGDGPMRPSPASAALRRSKLLAQLDDLSDEDLEALLMRAQNGGKRVTEEF